jgi:hypothetical protein
MHSWSTFGARMNHGQTQTHKIHHSPNLGETTTFPFIVFSMLCHKACTQMSFFPKTLKLRVPKFSKLRFSQLWKPITSCENFQLRWCLKQSYSLNWGFSNIQWVMGFIVTHFILEPIFTSIGHPRHI